MNPDKQSRQFQYLATMLTLVSSYYAIRVSLVLPKFNYLLMGLDGIDMSSVGKLILQHPYWFLTMVIIILTVTLAAVWKTFKHHDLVAACGIGLQFFLAERAVSSVVNPITEMISIMGSQ